MKGYNVIIVTPTYDIQTLTSQKTQVLDANEKTVHISVLVIIF